MFNEERVQLNLSPGETIFNVGDSGDAAYVVLDGEVEISANGILFESVEPGGIFGEMALIDKVTRSADAVAKTECRLAVLNQDRFLMLVQQTPRFATHMMKVLSDRLRRTTERSLDVHAN